MADPMRHRNQGERAQAAVRFAVDLALLRCGENIGHFACSFCLFSRRSSYRQDRLFVHERRCMAASRETTPEVIPSIPSGLSHSTAPPYALPTIIKSYNRYPNWRIGSSRGADYSARNCTIPESENCPWRPRLFSSEIIRNRASLLGCLPILKAGWPS